MNILGPTSQPRSPAKRNPIGARAATGLLALLLALAGYWMLFSNFAVYDDEGYILLSARQYFTHGHLYETVYSQYGPAFYVLIDSLQRGFGGVVDHTGARLLTLAFWLGAAGFCAGVVWRETTSRSLSLFTLGATFLYLYFITDEPFHPGSFVFFLLGGSVYLSARLIAADRFIGAAHAAGCIGTMLLLTKINVGIFYFAAIGAWAVTLAPPARLRWVFVAATVAALAVLAIALMHTLWGETWVQIYLAVFVAGAAALFATMRSTLQLDRRHAGAFLVSATLAGGVILGSVWWRGTTWAGLLEGVLTGPLRHPGNYSFPVDWRPGTLVLAMLSAGVALALPWLERRCQAQTWDRWIVGTRLILGSALLTGVALLMDFRAVGAIFSYLAPVIWIWVLPLKALKPDPRSQAARNLLAALLMVQFLHAYPVGGSQESWGTFLFMPLVAIGLGDVRRWLAFRPPTLAAPNRVWRGIGALLSGVVIAKVGWTAMVAGQVYHARTPLGLPGAALLRLPEDQRTVYRILAVNSAAHADRLFSAPGMFSFNLWTDLPPPTAKNTTLWFSLLNDAEQGDIINQLAATPRAAVIFQTSLVELMHANGIKMQGALWNYLHENFHIVFRSDGFAFCVRNGRTVIPVNIALVSPARTVAEAGPARDTALEFCLILDHTPITQIEIRTDGGTVPTRILDSTNTEIRLTPVSSSGAALRETRHAAWPIDGSGLTRVSIDFERQGLALASASTVLYLKGTDGQSLGEVRIAE